MNVISHTTNSCVDSLAPTVRDVVNFAQQTTTRRSWVNGDGNDSDVIQIPTNSNQLETSSSSTHHVDEPVQRMFIIQSNKPSYSGHIFASSSCCTEYDGKVESGLETKTTMGGLSRCGLRRSGSNVSEVLPTDRCQSDATQIELDFSVNCKEQVFVRILTPCGETGILKFDEYVKEEVFRPVQHGCGNGIWTIHVFQVIEHSETLLSSVSMPFNGVGTLYFAIGDDLRPVLVGKEFLHMSGACRKHSL